MNDIHQSIEKHIGGQPHRMKQGVGFDDKLGEDLSIAIIATGFSMNDVLGTVNIGEAKLGEKPTVPNTPITEPNTEKTVTFNPNSGFTAENKDEIKTEIKPEVKPEQNNPQKPFFTTEPVPEKTFANLNNTERKPSFSNLNDVIPSKMTNDNQVQSRDRATMLRSYSDEHRKREWRDDNRLERLINEPAYAQRGLSFPSEATMDNNIPTHFLNEQGQIRSNPYYDNTID
jgi:hypothetical protein